MVIEDVYNYYRHLIYLTPKKAYKNKEKREIICLKYRIDSVLLYCNSFLATTMSLSNNQYEHFNRYFQF